MAEEHAAPATTVGDQPGTKQQAGTSRRAILTRVGLLVGIMAVVFVLNLAVGAWALFISPFIWIPLLTAVIALVGLLLLFTRRANAFFR